MNAAAFSRVRSVSGVRFPRAGEKGRARLENETSVDGTCDARDRLPSRVTTNPGKECV